MQLFYGPIGVRVQENNDGTYVVLDTPADMDSNTWAWKYSIGNSCPGYTNDDFDSRITPPSDVRFKLDVDKFYSKYFKNEFFPVLNYNQQQTDDLSILRTDIIAYMTEKASAWIVNGGVEGEWDDYVSQLDRMNLDQMMKIYQEIYDDYFK